MNALPRDESSALREGLKSPFESQGHPFQEASVKNVGKWMTMDRWIKIRLADNTGRGLPQSAIEDRCPSRSR
jgi:hypothetical protein